MHHILAVIPARSGSKSIPHKNIKPLLGKPLMAHSIEHALNSTFINRVVVSTDEEMYAKIAVEYGAEVPFLRPPEISSDSSNDLDFFRHALSWLKEKENYLPDVCVQLRPTHPIRKVEDIDIMIKMLLANKEVDSVRSIIENKGITPYKMWFMDESGLLNPILTIDGNKEPFNTPRQLLPKTYFQNASIDVVRTECILKKGSLSGDVIMGYVMENQFDIDYEEDFIKAEEYLKKNEKQSIKNKKFCIDIDGVIASLTKDNNYALASPIQNKIKLINELFDNGNEIILFTARGSATGINWEEITKKQMNDWGVKYHKLLFGKPAADFYIDDRAINVNDFN